MRDKFGRFVKGMIAWNKGTKGIMKAWNKGKKGFKGFWKGKKFSKKHRKNMSKAFKGRIGYWKGKKRPPEMYKRIVAKRRAGKGYIVSKKTREAVSKVNKGKFREKAPNWKGGIYITERGYVLLYKSEHPFCNASGRIKRSRLVMEKHIGRFLKPKEVVHHKGIKYPISSIANRQDDRIENLMLFPNNSTHTKFHNLIGSPYPLGKLTLP